MCAPEDAPLDDRGLWPFYEKACELDIALTIHTGMVCYHMIGSALQWVADDKIVMGLDLAFDDMGAAVDYIRNLTMPDELQEQWGYKPIK